MADDDYDDGGHAFPTTLEHYQGGMTLRDYFAGQALVVLFSDETRRDAYGDTATYCYEIADAMIRARRQI